MKTIETTGRTVQEAVDAATEELGVAAEDITVEVISEASRGFLGIIGGRDARVRVTVKRQKIDLAKEFLQGITERMGVGASIETLSAKDRITLNVVGDDMGVLIGRRGETLRSLELLTSLVCGSGVGDGKRIFVDVAGYRMRRERELSNWAQSVARRVKRMGKKVTMEPMDARDRRIIHVTLQDEPGICTYSEGEDPFRRVVVGLKEEESSSKGANVR